MNEVLVPVQDRSRRTQERLLVAAAARLVEGGLAAFSTAAVASEAGMSQGAVFKHFPTKSHLLASTVAHMLRTLFDRFDASVAASLPALRRLSMKDRVALAIPALWAIFRGDELRAVFEVYVAARTDATLDDRLAPILVAHRARIHAEAQAIFHELAEHAEGPLAVDAIMFAMQGAAIGMFGGALRDDATNLAFFERLAMRELTLLKVSK